MIITCTSCMTKFNLDDSKIPKTGSKVRCSRCKHVFHVAFPPESQEQVIESFESFVKYHEDLMEPGKKAEEIPPAPTEPRDEPAEEEETSLFSDRVPADNPKKVAPQPEEDESKYARPKRKVKEVKRTPSLLLMILLVLAIVAGVTFYLGIGTEYYDRLFSFLNAPIQKARGLWEGVRGSGKEGLIVRDLNGYAETIGEVPLYIIEGKVNNQSKSAKKQIKVRVTLFDQNKTRIARKETICGRTISREELQNQPPSFFEGPLIILPRTENEMVTPPGKETPFILLFKNLTVPAKEFQVEILEAPNF